MPFVRNDVFKHKMGSCAGARVARVERAMLNGLE